jgi:tetratricopeptide (TPR) repeat protein
MQRSLRFHCGLLLLTAALAGCSHDAAPLPPEASQANAFEFPTSCNPAVQSDFNHAVALLHHMTYPQARAAFRDIATRDPACAMAQWGIAMTLFQPLWPTRPSIADLHLGWDTVQKAAALKPPTAREQAFIDAAAAFFREPDATDYWQRIARWETAMASVHASFPEDREATAFYALALLASARPGPTQQERSQKAVDLLLPLLRENPNHPGAMHYIIHADDIPGRELDDIDIVHQYELLAPDNPHALHMPTHIYTRLGDWDGVIRGNLRAADAALKYPAGDKGQFVWDEFPHAIEYLVYAYLQEGRDEEAAAQIARLMAIANLEPTAKTAFHLSSIPARYALEREDWTAAAALVPREPAAIDWDRSPWPEAIARFARGYGAVRTGNIEEARHQAERINELEDRASASGEDVFARQIRTLQLDLSAWIAHASQSEDAAISLMQQAVELEGATPKPPVTPAPTLPASELLGDLMLELRRPQDAVIAYRQSLQRFPRRFNGTLGVARSFAHAGDTAAAVEEYRELLRIAEHGTRPALREARDFVELHSAASSTHKANSYAFAPERSHP